MTEKTIVYGTPVCPMVAPVRNLLDRAAVPYDYINIFGDTEARASVREINAGNESVPTLRFSDGSTLTEPSLTELEAKLQALGHQIRPATWRESLWLLLDSPTARLVGVIFVAIGLATGQQTLLILGAIFLGVGMIPRLVKGS